jgi:hypothetical protein
MMDACEPRSVQLPLWLLIYSKGVILFLGTTLQKHAYGTVDTEAFQADFVEFFAGHEGLQQIDWQAWLHQPGMPPLKNQFDATLMEEAAELAGKWHFGDVMGIGSGAFHERSAADMDGWAGEKVAGELEVQGVWRRRHLESRPRAAARLDREVCAGWASPSSRGPVGW